MKPMPFLDEAIPQFDIVENLSIEGDPDGLILVTHRLISPAKVKDAQPCMGKPNRTVYMKSRIVRPTMIHHGNHVPEHPAVAWHAILCHESSYSAHSTRLMEAT
jgi:hypothetical protein